MGEYKNSRELPRLTEFRKACVIGWPINHSRSPLIHRFWLKEYKIDGDYLREAVAPDQLAQFFHDFRALGYCGANVTLPHKSEVLKFCDKTSALAQRLGAANTLWFEGDQLCGGNSDVGGFLNNLDEEAPAWDANCEHAVILGSGGAARAILAGLAERKVATVTLLNRSTDRARRLAEEAANWGISSIKVDSLDACGDALSSAKLLINTTSLGMAGQPKLELDLSALPADALVSDIIYTPLETELLKAAQARGLKTSSGLGMLLHQAVAGFGHWFGVKPKVTKELRLLIEADVERGSR
jgi:shikimate dehydrogenase